MRESNVRKITTFVIAVGLLVGCANTPTATEIGESNYTLTATAQLGFGSSRQEAADDAKEFCEQRNKKAIIRNFSDMPPIGLVGYSTSIIFTCQ